MDIRQWPLDKIMQLPDSCFGRRWPVFVEAFGTDETPVYDISEVALPERCVVWCFVWEGTTGMVVDTYYRLALGDRLPAAAAEMDALEPLFMGLGAQGPEPRRIMMATTATAGFVLMRRPIVTAGRRVVIEVVSAEARNMLMRAHVVVSSVPTEVPDWLVCP